MEINNYTAQGDQMLYKKQILFTAKGLIKDHLLITDGIVVLIGGSETIEEQNIYCYDFDGRLKWHVANPDKIYPTNYYTSIYLSDDNALQAYSKNGVEYTLNEEDGSILKKELIK